VQVRVKLSLLDGRGAPFMGAGLVWLLRRVEKLGSIRLAAKDMGMSYAKAHRILKGLERATGQKFLLRRRGGHERGGAQVTPYARRFIARYEKLEHRIGAYAREAFADIF